MQPVAAAMVGADVGTGAGAGASVGGGAGAGPVFAVEAGAASERSGITCRSRESSRLSQWEQERKLAVESERDPWPDSY